MITLALLLFFVEPGTAASTARKDHEDKKPPLVSILGRTWVDFIAEASKHSIVAQHRTDDIDGHEDFIMAAKPGTAYMTYSRVFVSSGKIDGLEIWANAPDYGGVFGRFRLGATIKQLEKEYGPAPYVSMSGREGQSSSGWVSGDYLIIVSGDGWGNTTDAIRIAAYKKDFLPHGYRARLGPGYTLQDLAGGKKYDGRKK